MASRPLPLDQQTASADWQQIEDRLDELAQVAKAATAAAQFYRQVLAQIVPASGVEVGAIWLLRDGTARLECEVHRGAGDAPGVVDPDLVAEVIRSGEPRIVPPQASPVATPCLVAHPFTIAPRTAGLIALVDHRPLGGSVGRAYLQLVAALAELIEDFHRGRELASLRDRADVWNRYQSFVEHAHRSLDVPATALAIANEGRRFLDCDRLSVLSFRGGNCRTLAVSGVDTFERRARLIGRLETLAAACARGGDPIWSADRGGDTSEQIQQPLDEYLDESHARELAVVPLVESQLPAERRPPRVIGVLVAESFQAGRENQLRERAGAMAPHSAQALGNALVHSHAPLAWLTRPLARLRWLTEARHLPKTVLAAAALAALAAVLALVPADFDIAVSGELQPQHRRDVFASDDGIVDQLLVDHGQQVRAGQPLVVLRKPQLDLDLRRIAGEIQTAQKKLASVSAQRLDNAPAPPESRRPAHQLTADEEELKQALNGLLEQQKVLEAEKTALVIASPMDGVALSWNLKQLLEARPVERGQSLVTIGDLNGPWVVELHVPDYRAGHVLAARESAAADLGVSFALAADPSRAYDGRLSDLGVATELDDSGTATLLGTVAFDRSQVAGLRPGATVNARVHCGRRSLGYVWLHDLFEFVQTRWWW